MLFDRAARRIFRMEIDGPCQSIENADVVFSIRSISGAFGYDIVCEAFGHSVAGERIGANNNGETLPRSSASLSSESDQALNFVRRHRPRDLVCHLHDIADPTAKAE
jgi:glutaminase